MSKYQEALNKIKETVEKADIYYYQTACTPKERSIFAKEDKQGLSTLQELVDRATPKKVDASKVITVYDYSTNQYETIVPCPNCANNIPFDNGFKFCPHCGQALDWGDEK